jgi:pyocin large subunit-like protein
MDTLFYDAAANEFAVLSKEGVIRTYFKPERGIDYWFTQIGGR